MSSQCATKCSSPDLALGLVDVNFIGPLELAQLWPYGPYGPMG